MRSLALGLLIAWAVVSQAATQSAPGARPKAGVFGPPPSAQAAQPLYLQADQMIYETGNKRIVARGLVELYFNNHIVTADEVIYEQDAGKLVAVGNAMLKDASGTVTKAERMQLSSDFVDAFAASLKVNETEPRFAVPPPK
jgi:LPS-assembly protein